MSNLTIVHWCDQRKRVLIPLVLIFFSIPIWFSIGDHTFNGRSGARYAVVAQDMVRTGDWVVPHYLGRIHLTKPPLVYWLESVSMSVLGHTYFAVRLPSAIAATLSLLVLFGFARKIANLRVAIIATGLYAIMPMTIAPARMTVTDSVVNLCWMAMLYAGYLCVHMRDQRRWYVLFWIAASLGMLAKGPVLFIPIGLVAVWWLIVGYDRRKPIGLVWFVLGLVLAMVPALGWAYAVYLSEPTALNIWRHETVDRAVGLGDHSRPIWFFIPVLLAGCFPASAMLTLPGLNLRLKQAFSNLLDGSLVGFLGWSIIVPFGIFSLISGKLPSYLLPICSPLALLSSLMLERWFDEANPELGVGRRIPEVSIGLLIGTLLYLLGIGAMVSFGYGPSRVLWVCGLVPAVIAAIVLVVKWKEQSFRVIGIGGLIGAWIIGWVVLEELEDVTLAEMTCESIIHETFGESGWDGPVGVYMLEDASIYWNQVGELLVYETPDELLASLHVDIDEPILIFTLASRWETHAKTNKRLFGAGTIRAIWEQWPGAPKRYLVVCKPIEASY